MSSFAAHSLTKEEVNRFSRQLILKNFGTKGQEILKDLRVLIIGAGGLGCPVSSYLAAAGVGKLGIVDHDEISIDNLHRQVLHSEQNVGKLKVDSIKDSIQRLNSNVEVETFSVLFTRENALQISQNYDVIADCSDNVATRYLINDVCILTRKPLVSGSALGWDGQLTVYGSGEKCPCYRCIFPKPPDPSTVTNCSDGGVLGPITGILGSMQALEIIKIAINGKSSFAGKLFLFDGLDGRTRNIRLRERADNCSICGKAPSITELQDYPQFCGSGPNDKVVTRKILSADERILPRDYELQRFDSSNQPVLIDTRPPTEFSICHLPEAKNITLDQLETLDEAKILSKLNKADSDDNSVFVVCHRGNDSQLAVRILQEKLAESGFRFRDIVGGLDRWALDVDQNFPRY
ncbi:Adenylyltransferase and sulfurtransferase MOCS3-like protein [Aphelenchoides bicaudatus]|nr:Adenylyltransferase and sulfurtransferase MOCS3-like protein [Aphelenchoides bicaudatus]